MKNSFKKKIALKRITSYVCIMLLGGLGALGMRILNNVACKTWV